MLSSLRLCYFINQLTKKKLINTVQARNYRRDYSRLFAKQRGFNLLKKASTIILDLYLLPGLLLKTINKIRYTVTLKYY